jgi:crotonobetainyl-CoA:carnitine CoA-transferase CaiB-like acyl-CoA transferase
MALLGADVIKIEGPRHMDMNREVGAVKKFNVAGMGTHFQSQGANKRAIALDLKSKEGREIFLRLVDTADVVVENFRSGVMDDLGLGYRHISERNPGIIYCSITGFGQTGPKRAHAAFDCTIQAFSGMIDATGPSDDEAVLIGPPVLDYGTGLQAAFAISSALLRRERSGEGQFIDVAMLDTALGLMTCGVLNVNTTGKNPGRSRHGRRPFAGYGGYRTADGEVLMIGACTPRQYARLWEVIGRDDLAREAESRKMWEMPDTAERDEAVLVEAFLTKSAAEWETILLDAGLPAGRVQTLKDALESDQIASRGLVAAYPSPHSKNGELRPAKSAFQCSVDGPAVTAPPPEFNEHAEDILLEIGIGADDAADLARRGVIGAVPGRNPAERNVAS